MSLQKKTTKRLDFLAEKKSFSRSKWFFIAIVSAIKLNHRQIRFYTLISVFFFVFDTRKRLNDKKADTGWSLMVVEQTVRNIPGAIDTGGLFLDGIWSRVYTITILWVVRNPCVDSAITDCLEKQNASHNLMSNAHENNFLLPRFLLLSI